MTHSEAGEFFSCGNVEELASDIFHNINKNKII